MGLPLIAAIVARTAVKEILTRRFGRDSISRQEENNLVQAIEEQIKKDPVLINETNSEKPYQSRVVVGASTAGVAGLVSLGIIADTVIANGWDLSAYSWKFMAVNIVTVAGSGYTLYGRLWNGLKPLFARK